MTIATDIDNRPTTDVQADRAAELRERLEEADRQTEVARLAFIDAQRDDPDAVRDSRRAWDRARSARNEIESLVLMHAANEAARNATAPTD